MLSLGVVGDEPDLGSAEFWMDDQMDLTQWHHLALTFDKDPTYGEVRLYINGFLRGTHREYYSRTSSPKDTTKNLVLRFAANTNEILLGDVGDWVGRIDELSIHKKALTEGQLRMILQTEWVSDAYDTTMLSTEGNESLGGVDFGKGDIVQYSPILADDGEDSAGFSFWARM